MAFFDKSRRSPPDQWRSDEKVEPRGEGCFETISLSLFQLIIWPRVCSLKKTIWMHFFLPERRAFSIGMYDIGICITVRGVFTYVVNVHRGLDKVRRVRQGFKWEYGPIWEVSALYVV